MGGGKRECERRNPSSRRLGKRRKINLGIAEDGRKGDRRKYDQRNPSNEKRSNIYWGDATAQWK